jgi:Mn-containing catalase
LRPKTCVCWLQHCARAKTTRDVDTIGEPTADLRSNIAAEARDDPGVKEPLGFLMTREIAHQKSFERALYAIEPNFPSGKLPGMPEFTNKYYNMSQGDGDAEGPWNTGPLWENVSEREEQTAVDGGDGTAIVKLRRQNEQALAAAASRTASDPTSDPTTGAELGAGSGSGLTGNEPPPAPRTSRK